MRARRDVIAHLRRVAPGHHYATSMAPPAAQQIVSALRLLRGEDGSGRGAAKLAALHANSNWFRRRLLELGCHVLGDWDSPVMVRLARRGPTGRARADAFHSTCPGCRGVAGQGRAAHPAPCGCGAVQPRRRALQGLEQEGVLRHSLHVPLNKLHVWTAVSEFERGGDNPTSPPWPFSAACVPADQPCRPHFPAVEQQQEGLYTEPAHQPPKPALPLSSPRPCRARSL